MAFIKVHKASNNQEMLINIDSISWIENADDKVIVFMENGTFAITETWEEIKNIITYECWVYPMEDKDE